MFKIVIVGRPNVGKSTLFNTLIGERKAIVERTPGVTRDMLCGYVELEEGKVAEVIDTGGITWGENEFFQKKILEIVQKVLNEADLVLFVVDGKEGLVSEDQKIAEYLRKFGKDVILVINKVDGIPEKSELYDFYSLGFEDLIFISAKHKKNIETLKELLKKRAEDKLEDFPETTAVKIAVMGRPNVGKSTLVNKLIGDERMIVSEIPGTTTDCVDIVITLPNGKNYIIIDTPGIRRRTKIKKRAEKFSVDKALHLIPKADVILYVLTAEEGVTHQDQRLLGQIEKNKKACIVLVNKWDLYDGKREQGNVLMENIKYGIRFLPWVPIFTISAKTGRRLDKIFPLVDKIFEEYSRRIETSKVNKVLEELKENYSFNIKGKKLKFYYATQVDIRPPTFVIFTNIDPEDIPKRIEKFFEKSFQNYLGFHNVPVKIIFRKRERK